MAADPPAAPAPKPYRRTRARRVAKWAGAVICVVIAAAFSLGVGRSFGRTHYWSTPRVHGAVAHFRTVMIFAGALHFSRSETADEAPEPEGAEWFWQEASNTIHWWPAWGTVDAWIPLWIPFALFAIPTALLWRSDHLATKRARIGRCPRCNYDLSGLSPATTTGDPAETALCPECGESPSSTAISQ